MRNHAEPMATEIGPYCREAGKMIMSASKRIVPGAGKEMERIRAR
jgi:hypothetical protein